jgi:hypothetical protein
VRRSALCADLLDRSRFPTGTAFVARGDELDELADVVAVDLSRPDAVDAIARLRAAGSTAWVVAYGSHVDRVRLDDARDAGADEVLARSEFFADVESALVPPRAT